MMEACLLFILSLFLGLLVGKYEIAFLRREKVGQTVREDGPKRHYAKSGTPTFGGLIFLLPFCLGGMYHILRRGFGKESLLFLFVVAISLIGFCDDYVKVKINKEGLSVRQKTMSILVLIVLFLLSLRRMGGLNGFYLPFARRAFVTLTGAGLVFFALLALFYFYACINAVNITDGEDGLCVSVSAVALIFVLLIAGISSFQHVDNRLLPLSLPLLGGMLAFFFYNRHPARIFMGDFGSLALGAFISGSLFLIGQLWLFLLIGIIYWVEIGSVFLQVMYFKKTGGKRIFRMSPIHHHFELGGWSENRIGLTFSLITALAGLAALFAALGPMR